MSYILRGSILGLSRKKEREKKIKIWYILNKDRGMQPVP